MKSRTMTCITTIIQEKPHDDLCGLFCDGPQLFMQQR
jgi:hypothetical protein